ncbi:MAG: addiction module toxin RelE [Alphaproteobacteria bacterium]
MPDIPVSVCETTLFQRTAADIMAPNDIEELINHLACNPEAGDVIPGTGGIRKIRWRRAGRGKRGGARVIYYYHDETLPLLMLLAYAKSAAADIIAVQKRRMAALVSEFVRAHKQRRWKQ